jgi:3-dehydroquinate synthase II
LLIGSSSKGMVLVHGETIENPYAAVRPFRVNAGAVHSYVLVPGGRTRYLSEARAGTLVMLVDREGAARASHVGRLKIERRPLVLVEVEAGGLVFNAILQNAETVRLVTPGGHASVRELKAGDEVLVHLPAGPEAGPGAGGRGGKGGKRKGDGRAKGVKGAALGRHFGRAVPERVIEG